MSEGVKLFIGIILVLSSGWGEWKLLKWYRELRKQWEDLTLDNADECGDAMEVCYAVFAVLLCVTSIGLILINDVLCSAI